MTRLVETEPIYTTVGALAGSPLVWAVDVTPSLLPEGEEWLKANGFTCSEVDRRRKTLITLVAAEKIKKEARKAGVLLTIMSTQDYYNLYACKPFRNNKTNKNAGSPDSTGTTGSNGSAVSAGTSSKSK
ncbi:hypothetical protein [Actinotignum urinale]|uniref:hypothetical protein n=1 Tax=Actinotignum urinale TaxID=190146 RepID=UPI0003B7AC80|nr:hypothetical protein [Actinotignum urinale]MDY5160974.1 hypothetical protein [Actinotignum urinale]